MNLDTLKGQVEWVLTNVEESRNSDVTLMIELWKRFFPQRIKKGLSGEEGVWLKDLYDLPREDGIKRMRAHYQNDLKQYLPTDWEIAKRRQIAEDVWRNYMSGRNY